MEYVKPQVVHATDSLVAIQAIPFIKIVSRLFDNHGEARVTTICAYEAAE